MLGRRSKEKILLEAAVKAKINIVIDNTNISIAHRQKYIPLLKKNGYDITAIYFLINIENAIKRNAKRKRKVPNNVIKKYAKNIVEPSFNEGFYQIKNITELEKNGRT